MNLDAIHQLPVSAKVGLFSKPTAAKTPIEVRAGEITTTRAIHQLPVSAKVGLLSKPTAAKTPRLMRGGKV